MINRIVGGVLVATTFSVLAYHLGGSYLQEEVDYAHLARDYFGEWQIKKIIQPELECEVGSGVAEDTECLVTDRLCFLVGNGRVRELTLPHGVMIRDVSVENAECDANTIGTIDLCNLPCGGSGSGVSAEACFEAMQGRDFVLSLTGGITADIELAFQNASAWSDLMAADETWAGSATAGWRASYSSGGCDFELFLTYQAGDGWTYWLNAYEDKREATLNTCDPFNIEIALDCGGDEVECDPDTSLLSSAIDATFAGDLSALGTKTLNKSGDTWQWSGNVDVGCPDNVVAIELFTADTVPALEGCTVRVVVTLNDSVEGGSWEFEPTGVFSPLSLSASAPSLTAGDCPDANDSTSITITD